MSTEELYDAFEHIDGEFLNVPSARGSFRRSGGKKDAGSRRNLLPVLLTAVLLVAGIVSGALIARSIRGRNEHRLSPDVQTDNNGTSTTATPTAYAATPTAYATLPVVTPAPAIRIDAEGWPRELPAGEEELKQLEAKCFDLLADNYPELRLFDPAQMKLSSHGLSGGWTVYLTVSAGGYSITSYGVDHYRDEIKLNKNTQFPDDLISILQSLPEDTMREYEAKLESIVRAQIVPRKLKEPDDLRSEIHCYWTYNAGPYLECESIIYTVDPDSTEFGCGGHAHIFGSVKIAEAADWCSQYENGPALTMMQYTWDGWGISVKTVNKCAATDMIVQLLGQLEETGELAEALSKKELDLSGLAGKQVELPAPYGTMWFECDGKIYRFDPDMKQLCRVETYLGRGRVLACTEDLRKLIANTWHYYPYDFYEGTYDNKTGELTVSEVFSAETTVHVTVKKIELSEKDDPSGHYDKITLELVSDKDQYLAVDLHSEQSDHNFAVGSSQKLTFTAGESRTLEMGFGGWRNVPFWITVTADNTRVRIRIVP